MKQSVNNHLLKHVESFFGPGSAWVVQVIIVLLITLVAFYFVRVGFFVVRRRTKDMKGIWYNAFIKALSAPLGWLVWVLGLFFSLRIVGETFKQIPIFGFIDPAEKVLMMLLVIWFLSNFVKHSKENALAGKGKNKPDVTSIHALAKLGKMVVIAIGALLILQVLGVPLSGVVAFGGGSALVVGIAAKDLLANFFGGWVVIMDKPFKVGDWIRSPDKQIEGTVEYIGWRSTRIRTFDKRPLYVPNYMFTTISIENPSRMQNRRIKTTVGIRYDDANELAGITDEIEVMLKNHPEIDQETTTFVKMINFGASSLDIQVYTFTKTTNWVKFQGIQQDVFLKIMKIVEDHGAEVAFPTRTLEMPKGMKLEQQHEDGPVS